MAAKELSKTFRLSKLNTRVVPSCRVGAQQRTFTASTACLKQGDVPAFTETSSPELQDVLSSFRDNVFIPARLSKQHQDLVYKTKHITSLEDEPIHVEISGDNFRLRHIDRTKDVPGTIAGVKRAVALMKDKRDWDNLPLLLEGVASTGKKMSEDTEIFNKLVRLAARAGRQDVILECARRVSKTGFQLKNFDLVREIMWWIQYKALASNWDSKETKKALRMAEQICDLLEDERHSGGNVQGPLDPRTRPEVVGVLLELAAAQAKITATEEDKEKVAVYAKRMLAVINNGSSLRDGYSVDTPEKHVANNTLRYASTILYGIRQASQILDDDVSRLLQKHSGSLAEEAAAARATVEKEFPKESLSLWSDKLLAEHAA